MTKRFVMRAALALVMAGCAVTSATSMTACSAGSEPPAPQLPGEVAESVTTPVSTVTRRATLPDPVPGQTLPSSEDPASFARCIFPVIGTSVVTIAPTFIVRIPDAEGAIYGFQDGYTLPFPTPWLAAKGGSCQGPDGAQNCTFSTPDYDFEQAVNTEIPGIVSHEFLVRELTFAEAANPDGGKRPVPGFVIGLQKFFYNGTEDMAALGTMAQIIAQANAEDAGVDAQPRTCVYVLEENAAGYLVPTGFHSKVGQSHDPINWPN